MKQKTETIKVKSGNGMVRNLNSLAPNTLPRFIGFDFVDGEFIQNDKVEEILINRNNQHYYRQQIREGALVEIKDTK